MELPGRVTPSRHRSTRSDDMTRISGSAPRRRRGKRHQSNDHRRLAGPSVAAESPVPSSVPFEPSSAAAGFDPSSALALKRKCLAMIRRETSVADQLTPSSLLPSGQRAGEYAVEYVSNIRKIGPGWGLSPPPRDESKRELG